MKGQQLFLHSVRQVTGNLDGALRVSALPFGVQALVGLVMVGGAMQMAPAPGNGAMGAMGLGSIVAMAVMIITFLWLAVAWHRFVLLGERPAGYVPAWNGQRMWAYFLRSLGYGLIIVFAGAVWGMIVGMALGWITSFSVVLFMILMAVLVQLPILVVAFRLTAALPAAALEEPGDFMAGWNATNGQTTDIAVLSVIVVAANLILSLLSGFVFGPIPVIGVLWEIAVSWLLMMVSASILTTLYGHYVQGRPLV